MRRCCCPAHAGALVLALRFATGLCLAGIYPVGMKIAADYFENGLGRALGYLVGALVLGTALPHLLRLLAADVSWQAVVLATSGLAAGGRACCCGRGCPNGPFRRPAARLQAAAVWQVFRDRPFRQAALGYFGHMWELYTFWAFVPLLLATHARLHPAAAGWWTGLGVWAHCGGGAGLRGGRLPGAALGQPAHSAAWRWPFRAPAAC